MSNTDFPTTTSEQSLFERPISAEEDCKRWRVMCEHAPDYMSVINAEGRFLWYNRPHPTLSREQILSSTIFDFEEADNADVVRKALSTCLAAGNSRYRAHYTVNGQEYWSDVRMIRVDIDPAQVLVTTSDVTSQVTAERSLDEANRQLQAGQRLAELGYWEWQTGGAKVLWNDEVFKMYGRSPEAYTPTLDGVRAALHPDDVERTEAIIDQALRDKEPFVLEHRIMRPDGEVRHLTARAEVVQNGDDKPLVVRGCVLDITRVRRAERAASFWEARLRAAVHAAKQLVYDWNAETDELSLAGDVEQFFGASPPMTGKDWEERIGKSNLFRTKWLELSSKGSAVEDRYDLQSDRGLLRVEEHSELLLAPDGRPHIVGLVNDISLSKKQEEHWKSELQQREALLREVHHRIKNNLQMLVSMGHLQLRQSDAEQSLMDELGLRVRAMALSYDLVNRNGDTEWIELNTYLESLFESARSMFQGSPVDWQWRGTTTELCVSPEQATPCGLLAVEILTYLHKCAKKLFHEDLPPNPGKITLTLGKLPDGWISLRICSTVLESVEPKQCGPDRLVQALVAQLRGTLEKTSTAGTVHIRFPSNVALLERAS